MSIFKKFIIMFLLGVVALAALAVIIAVQQPENYRVERSIEINAPAETIFQQFDDLRNWGKWSPWVERDPDMIITYSDQSAGVGAFSRWQSETEGSGVQTITESVMGEKLAIELHFMEPWSGKSTADLVISKQDNGSKRLTWGMDGKNDGLTAKFFYHLMNVQKRIGQDFEGGLEKIKRLAEDG